MTDRHEKALACVIAALVARSAVLAGWAYQSIN